MLRLWLALALLGGVAAAEGRRVFVPTPPESLTEQAATPAKVLYLNRCTGGCTIVADGTNDAVGQHTSILPGGRYVLSEYVASNGMTGSGADVEWGQLVQCIKEVYSPYDLTVTDQQPAAGTVYNEAIIAGKPGDVGEAPDILGIAPLANNCSAEHNVISFSFANQHPEAYHVVNVCWTAAQESAHAYGLDHEYEFTDGTSACNDPMTYRTDCGGQKFFRNKLARCGEQKVRDCKCSATQNSHAMLLGIFGEGNVITPPPDVSLTTPAPGATTIANGDTLHASAYSQRGVADVQFYFNGSRWGDDAGTRFGGFGQGVGDYPFTLPDNFPDGITDIEVIAYDDLGFGAEIPLVTVTKGAPCTDASQCLKDQTCDSGRCVFGKPHGTLGETCTYDQFCESWTCLATSAGQRCSQRCDLALPSSCPSDFDCIGAGQDTYCWPKGGGCCSVGGQGEPFAPLGLAFFAAVFVMRRRKR
jgi:Bacterial Ig domain